MIFNMSKFIVSAESVFKTKQKKNVEFEKIKRAKINPWSDGTLLAVGI